MNEYNAPRMETTKVDMLFVVDNSGSMAGEQKILADSFASFIDQFYKRDVDFHIGVITTDVSNAGNSKYWTGKLSGFVDPDMGRLLSKTTGERFLNRDSLDLINKFKANVKVGTSGSGSEQGLNSVSLALDDSKLKGGFNDGFLRDDAMLSVIVVSDENEDIRNKESIDQRIDRVVNRLKQLKGADSRGYRLDFVVNSSVNPVAYSYPLPGEAFYPEVYLAAATKTSSKVLDIQKNFGSELVGIGGDIINQAQSEFKLTEKAIAGSVKVKIDGKSIAADPVDGFVFHADRNTVELKGAALSSSPGAKIVIEYQYLSL